MNRFFAILLFFSGTVLFAGEKLSIDASYRIVVPSPGKSRSLDHYYLLAARTLASEIEAASGIKLKIEVENPNVPQTPAIHAGPVKALEKSGLKPERYAHWEHRIDVKENDIFLHGDDTVIPGTEPWNFPPERCTLGSLKAALAFLEKFAGTVFHAPGQRSTPPGTRLQIPAQTRFHTIPAVNRCSGSRQEVLYDVANNFFYSPFFGSHGGHSYDYAVPEKKYYGLHPEYYALIGGKRYSRPHGSPQLCISNPEVQNLIRQELIDHLDQGFEAVQLGQGDGFKACECENCKKLFNVGEFGEKLWILHRDIARKLLEQRPGKVIQIMAYGPAMTPPRTFKEFPANVCIELAPCTPEVIESWKNHRVPRGFAAYLYNWGVHNPEGFTPKRSISFCRDQTGEFRRNRIGSLYLCGFGDLFGLEGPTYYIWGKLLENPDADTGKLLKIYCSAAFGTAAPEMERFFILLDQQLEIMPEKQIPDYNNLTPTFSRKPISRLTARFPDAKIRELETLLASAESKGKNPQSATVRTEFDYLKHTAGAAVALERFRKEPSPENSRKLFHRLAERDRFIQALPLDPKGYLPAGIFGRGVTKDTLKSGGRLSGLLFAPFTWNAQRMETREIQPAGRRIKPDGTWHLLVPGSFSAADTSEKTESKISVTRDAEALYVTIAVIGVAPESRREKFIFQVTLGPEKKLLQWRPGNFLSRGTGRYNFQTENAKNNGRGDKYKYFRKNREYGRITSPAPGVPPTENTASARMRIPFDAFDRIPRPGDRWLLNVFFKDDKGSFTCLEYNFDQMAGWNASDKQSVLEF